MIELSKKAVILARGMGTRMRAARLDHDITAEQKNIADQGIKALIPVAGNRTLLELLIHNLTTAGFSDICLVIGPEHDTIRDFCKARGLAANFAIQIEARGTADAVLAAKHFVGNEGLFLVVNSDNLYGVEGLSRLRKINRPAMLAYERRALVERSNISVDRIAKFATVEVDASGDLCRIVEKPGNVAADSFVSMNAWLFSPVIFEACRLIGPSERGEYEITAAVQYAIDHMSEIFTAVKTDEGVLDLSNRADIAGVARFLNYR